MIACGCGRMCGCGVDDSCVCEPPCRACVDDATLRLAMEESGHKNSDQSEVWPVRGDERLDGRWLVWETRCEDEEGGEA